MSQPHWLPLWPSCTAIQPELFQNSISRILSGMLQVPRCQCQLYLLSNIMYQQLLALVLIFREQSPVTFTTMQEPLWLYHWGKQTVLHALVEHSQLVSLQLLLSVSTMAGQILGLFFIFLPPCAMLVLAFVYHLVKAITFSQLLRAHLEAVW